MYHCKNCKKEFEFEESPFDLKCKLNPELAQKETWDKSDWEAPIGFCDCGGIIEAGVLPNKFCQIAGKHGFWSRALGVNPNQIQDELKRHPDWKFSKDGKLWVKGFTDQKKKAKELGYLVG